MARRQHHNSISLFPFLAVLVCAMGSLILLLLVLTRKIRQDQQADISSAMIVASETSLADRSTEIVALENQIASTQESLTGLRLKADSLLVCVTDRRDQVRALEQELSELKARLSDPSTAGAGEVVTEALQENRQLRAKEAALLRQLKDSERQLLEKQLQLTKAEEASKEAELLLKEKHSDLLRLRSTADKARQKNTLVSGTETLLEFSNSTGTARTPIVIDVSGKGFEVLPNGVRITSADMEGFPVRDNPLLSAILTTHRYRAKGAVTDEPYVLLLVRPDGALTFYGAQRVLMESGIHYGYELLEQERQIVVGEPDAAEVPMVTGSIEEAFRRRDNLYAKLMAIAEQKSDLSNGHGEARAGTGERRLTVRPDGRVVLDEGESRRPLDGRFYAGGVAPPASLMKNRPIGGYRAGEESMSPADAERMADEFAAQYLRQQQVVQETGSAASPFDKLANDSSQDPKSTASGDAIRSPAERKFAETMFGNDGTRFPGSQGTGRPDTPAIEEIRNPSLASIPQRSAASGSTKSSMHDSFPHSVATTNPAGSRSDSSEWPTSSLLMNDDNPPSATTATGRPPEQMGRASESLLFAGEPGAPPSTGIPDLSRIDPDLLKRLNSGKNASGSLATPVGITVFLDANYMTVGQQSAVEVTSENLDAAFASLLTGINTEVNDRKRKPGEPLMPIVKFIVSPGGEKWRIPLAHSLKRTGIHSAVIYELTPYITVSDTTGRATISHESE